MFERLLVNHCSPTLAGIKAANLFMYKGEEAQKHVEYWNLMLNSFGLKLIILKKCEDRSLIYIYRENLLKNILAKKEVQTFLKTFGYYYFENLSDTLYYLSKRVSRNSFPHEIGIFLDYPLEDVRMFIKKQGKQYKYSGLWKVYFNVEKSRAIFESYKSCTNSYSHQFLNGAKITNLCTA